MKKIKESPPAISSRLFLAFPQWWMLITVMGWGWEKSRREGSWKKEQQKHYVRLISSLSFPLWPGGEASGVCGTSSRQQHTHRSQTPLWSLRRDWGVHSQLETWRVRPWAWVCVFFWIVCVKWLKGVNIFLQHKRNRLNLVNDVLVAIARWLVKHTSLLLIAHASACWNTNRMML